MSAGPLVVVGDVLLDVDLEGRATRLSPDAPVPVLDDLVATPRPGGAGLTALLAAADGRDVVLVTALAGDDDARLLTSLLHDAGVRVVALQQPGTTAVKKRVRAAGQSLLRLDTGEGGEPGAVPPEAVDAIGAAAAVLVSDYGRGVTRSPRLRAALADAVRRAPVTWDPHPRGSAPVRGTRVVTPNADEAARLAGDVDTTGLGPVATLTVRAEALLERWGASAVAVTLGARGALVAHGGSSPSVFPAPRVRAADPCGAGDRFAGCVAGALADGALVTEAVELAVRRAAAFVAAGGASSTGAGPRHADDDLDPVERVRAAGGTVVATGGCFDLLHAGHVATLEAARALGDCLVVCLNSDASVSRLKGPTRPLVPQADRARVLAALEPVDAVLVFDEDTPHAVLERLRPDVWVKGGDYAGADLPEAALLRQWGAQSVVLPYLEGRSTTGLVAAAAGTTAPR